MTTIRQPKLNPSGAEQHDPPLDSGCLADYRASTPDRFFQECPSTHRTPGQHRLVIASFPALQRVGQFQLKGLPAELEIGGINEARSRRPRYPAHPSTGPRIEPASPPR